MVDTSPRPCSAVPSPMVDALLEPFSTRLMLGKGYATVPAPDAGSIFRLCSSASREDGQHRGIDDGDGDDDVAAQPDAGPTARRVGSAERVALCRHSGASNDDGSHWPPLDPDAAAVAALRRGAPALPSPPFGNRFLFVAPSPTAGWGAFAATTLRRGDVILRERPLFVADYASLFDAFDRLDPAARRVVLGLHANALSKRGTPLIQDIWVTNCFSVEDGRRAGLFPVAARFNHACYPARNVAFRYDHVAACLILAVCVNEVSPGAELRISYGRDRTPAELYMTYGFRCRCGACCGLSDGDLLSLTCQW